MPWLAAGWLSASVSVILYPLGQLSARAGSARKISFPWRFTSSNELETK